MFPVYSIWDIRSSQSFIYKDPPPVAAISPPVPAPLLERWFWRIAPLPSQPTPCQWWWCLGWRSTEQCPQSTFSSAAVLAMGPWSLRESPTTHHWTGRKTCKVSKRQHNKQLQYQSVKETTYQTVTISLPVTVLVFRYQIWSIMPNSRDLTNASIKQNRSIAAVSQTLIINLYTVIQYLGKKSRFFSR